jgi:hypothetical protein
LATPAILGAVVTNVLCDPALTVVLINWVSIGFDGWHTSASLGGGPRPCPEILTGNEKT